IPMEDAFPFVCVSGMGNSNPPSSHFRNIKETSTVAASFAVTTIPPIGGVSQRPVGLRILIKVWRKKEGILAKIISIPTRIVEHRKAHVEVVRARRHELYLIGDFI